MGKLSQSRVVLIFCLSLTLLLTGCGRKAGSGGDKETGTIYGYVHNPLLNKPFAGAKITASQQGEKGLTFTATANDSGNYTLEVPVGVYTLNFTHASSFPYLIKDVKVDKGGKTKVDVTLVISFGGT